MSEFVLGEARLTIEDVVEIAYRRKTVRLSRDPEFVERINVGAAFIDEALEKHGGIYGVTTGYGDSCDKTVPPDRYYELPLRLTRFHGCGLGEMFDPATTRAIILVRLNTLVQGYSGVGYDLLTAMEQLLVHDILPLIPQEGSVGASGDLTPLSYVAGVVIGERDVLYHGSVRNSGEVFRELGLPLVRLRPKEGLAVMNGTAVMNAVACIAFSRARYLADLSCRITGLNSIALNGNAYHFNERLFDIKPHPGQALAAKKIREDLRYSDIEGVLPERIQDQYSIRCAPHVIGVAYDFEPLLRQMVETEMNSANDNPIIDPESSSIFHGGHFYGGHIAFAMDSLKNIVANISDLLDRQLALLVDEKFNRGLPPNLSGSGESFSYNHGFKAVQIGASAWTAEALKNTMPASVFSRSTECHNQDKVSMGTISARDCIRVLELSEQTAAAALLAAVQAVRLRVRDDGLEPERFSALKGIFDQVDEAFEFLADDRPLEGDLRRTVEGIRTKTWKVRDES